MMNLCEIAKNFNYENYPKELDFYLNNPAEISITDDALIEKINAEYSVFPKYRNKISECIAEVKKIPELELWGNILASYINKCDFEKAKSVKLPEFEKDTPLRYFRLLVFASLIPSAISTYLKRGFSKEEIKEILCENVEVRVSRSEARNKKQGLDERGYLWLLNFAKAKIFKAGIFNVTPIKLYNDIVIAKNKTDGSLRVFKENEFKKDNSQLEILLKKGDGIAAIHIPVGAALTADNIENGFKEALKKAQERYPELSPVCIHCTSWLLDPKLKEVLKEGSNILRFQDKFLTYPVQSDEKSIFGFVFPNNFKSYSELPEDTTLRKKLKEMYIKGDYIYEYAGAVFV